MCLRVIDRHETAGGTDGREGLIKVVGSISLLNFVTVSWIQKHSRGLPEFKDKNHFVKCDISATSCTKQNWFGRTMGDGVRVEFGIGLETDLFRTYVDCGH